ncbi:hypothetical protein [Rhizobium mesoamericanum]|uniref:hypothetical protein n=1 Tax=Rhizobium mesoamericanum TaxID=1079800 RepID=UPI000415A7AE|nr:hypothetical protein [Rhizobium mesoamericanum]
MEILSIRRETSGGNTVARFDVALGDHIRMFNLKLIRGRAGLRVYAPSAYGSNVATFSTRLTDQMITAVSAALGEESANDRSNAA